MLVDSSPFCTTILEDDFEPDLSSWVATHGAGTVDWSLTIDRPAQPHPRGVRERSGRRHRPVPHAGGTGEPSPRATGSPSGTAAAWRSGFDGGVVEVSTDGGATWTDIGAAAFTENGYNATISTCCANPLGGRRAFSGTSPYVKSVASLAAYVGQNILVRFRTGTDSSVAGAGWTVDDVHIGNEVSTTNVLTTRSRRVPRLAPRRDHQIIEPAHGPGGADGDGVDAVGGGGLVWRSRRR